MSILKNILKGEPVPPSEAVKTLQLRVERPAPPTTALNPERSVFPVEPVELGPQTRRHIEHLERQYKMEQLRTRDLREQLLDMDARLTVLMEAGHSDLVEDYEGLAPEDVIPWVERVLLPAYGLAVEKLKGGAA